MGMRILRAAGLLLAVAGSVAAQDLQVGVYAGPGSDAADREALLAVFAGEGFAAREVRAGGLDGLDLLVVGGGGGTSLAKGLGPEGAAAVLAFVRAGGGYLGLGAGAYLGARGYNPSTRLLELVDAALVDRPNWKARGEGTVELAPLAGQPLGALPGPGWLFSKGPLFAPAHGLDRVPYRSCATFVTDLSAGDRRRAGTMPGTDAIVCAPCGKGRAVLFSVLAHRASGTQEALRAAARWAAGAGSLDAPAAPSARGIKVAVLDDEGCIGDCVARSLVCLADEAFWVRRVDGREVRAGRLKEFDVVLLPGGSATKQSGGLGDAGRAALKEFVAGGGGYVGICAGAYLAAAEPTRYGLGLAAARCVDTRHWKRGTGIVELEASEAFAQLTGRQGVVQQMLYANGPLLEAMEVEGLPEVVPLLRFVSDIHARDAPAGVMPGKLAGLRTRFRRGRVVLFSTHPELTRGFEPVLSRAVRWVAGK